MDTELLVNALWKIVKASSEIIQFLKLEVGDGAVSADTIRFYPSLTKQYLDWCRDNLLPPLEADSEDIKLYP